MRQPHVATHRDKHESGLFYAGFRLLTLSFLLHDHPGYMT